MNMFRTMSRAMVVAAVAFVGNASAVDMMPVIAAVGNVLHHKHVQPIVGGALMYAGGDILKDHKDLAAALFAGLAVNALTQNALAGTVATGTCLGVSGVRSVVPDVPGVNAVTDKLPDSLTSKDAKMAAQTLVVIAGVSMYYGIAAGKGNGN